MGGVPGVQVMAMEEKSEQYNTSSEIAIRCKMPHTKRIIYLKTTLDFFNKRLCDCQPGSSGAHNDSVFTNTEFPPKKNSGRESDRQ